MGKQCFPIQELTHMEFTEYSILFKIEAQKKNFTSLEIEKCLDYAKRLYDKSLPVIYDTQHLSLLVGYNKKYIKRAVQYTPYFYRYFKIEKKNGSKRQIAEPLPSLKEIQHWILYEILYKIKIHKYSKAYIKGKSIKDNVKFHKCKKIVLTLDIHDFFKSLTIDKVGQCFKEMGYSSILADLLAKICCLNGSLPQGAPTSPYISNIIMYNFDLTMQNFCNTNKIMYTRYADDITLSGDIEANGIIELVKKELHYLNLELNENKTKIMHQNERQIVTGVVVNDKIQVPRTERNEIRMIVHCIKKFGLEGHLQRIDCQKENYIKHLLGRINYILYINPNDKEFLEYNKYIKETIE